jgi:hypothetical protein
MTRRWLLSIVLAGFILAAPAAASADGFGHAPSPGVTVGGTVATPMTYSLGQLQPLETTFTVTRPSWWGRSHTDTLQGVPVETLVNDAEPTPRLVTDGDVKGGRYVSGVVDLVVGQSQLPGWPRWGDR